MCGQATESTQARNWVYLPGGRLIRVSYQKKLVNLFCPFFSLSVPQRDSVKGGDRSSPTVGSAVCQMLRQQRFGACD